jgi:hypothetical protein
MSENYLIKSAPQFDVHKWSDFPEVNTIVDAILEEIKECRKLENRRVRNWAKTHKHLKIIIIELWSAHKNSTNPYRAISKNKSDYQVESRYRKIFLKYDYFIGVIDDLIKLEYIYQKIGARYSNTSFRTRIKATEKLINTILNPDYKVNEITRLRGNSAIISRSDEVQDETIILRNSDLNNIDYEDTQVTIRMRENLALINRKIADTRITLDIDDTQYRELTTRLSSDTNTRPSIDFNQNQLYRVFNHSSFENGGRFYGGWWQHIPKEFRKYISINRKPIVELDYSGHHIRILYSMVEHTPPDDPYDIASFPREDQKKAILIIINADNEKAAIKAINNEGISNAKCLVNAIKTRHDPIKDYFSSGVGNMLMYKDSVLAERVMLRMLERGATVLPVHDSFIVRNSYDRELEEIMIEEFTSMFDSSAALKVKKTALEELPTGETSSTYRPEYPNLQFSILNKTWRTSIWGID